MTRSLLLLLPLVVLPLVAQARGHRSPRTHETRCGRTCAQEMHAARFVEDAARCGPSEHQLNAVVCEANQGDGFVACGADCGWNFAEDRDHPLPPRAGCGADPKTPGPAVRCKAFGVATSKD